MPILRIEVSIIVTTPFTTLNIKGIKCYCENGISVANFQKYRFKVITANFILIIQFMYNINVSENGYSCARAGKQANQIKTQILSIKIWSL